MHCILCRNQTSDADATLELQTASTVESLHQLDGKHCEPCQAFIDLEKRISAAKESLSSMMSCRNTLLTEINRRHDPLTRRLPPEILCRIFKFYTSINEEKETWSSLSYLLPNNKCLTLLLGAVCRDWRWLAWSTPKLWRSIRINFKRADDWNCVDIVKQCLDRSGKRPLFIQLTCCLSSIEGTWDHQGALQGLISVVVNSFSDRWQSLEMHCAPEILPLICGNTHGAPTLRRLFIKLRDSDDILPPPQGYIFSLTGMNSPVYLEARGINFQSLAINWSQVTRITFETAMPLYEGAQLLRHAPQLVHCTLTDICDSKVGYSQAEAGTPFVHRQLQNLSIDNYYGQKLNLFFNSFLFPALKQFGLFNWPHYELDVITDLFQRSSCSLESLMLSDAICTTEQLRRLLDTSPSLHKLELVSCDAVVEPDPMEILRFLAATADGTMSLLPNLQHLHYSTDSYTWTAELWALTPKVLRIQDIHSPNRRQLKTLSFDISGDIGDKELGDLICKDKNVVMRLADAVRSGTEIELLHYSSRDVLKLSLAHHQLTLS